MNCRMYVLFVFASIALQLAAGGPVIREGSVVARQDKSRKVTITYTLDAAPAVITVDVLTNGVSIGSSNFTNMTGDVNVIVQPGESRKVEWRANRSWPFHSGNAVVKVKAWPLDAPPDYLVVYDLTREGCVRYYTDADAVPGGVTNAVYKTEQLVMRRIHANCRTFNMNAPKTFKRKVSFTNDYYIGIYFLTQGQVMNIGAITKNPSNFATEAYPDHLKYPMNKIAASTLRGGDTWPDGGHANVSPTSTLGLLSSRTGLVFDMPTSAEWEYAMRAGSDTMFFWGKSTDRGVYTNYIWAGESYNNGVVKPHEVGLLKPNPWGIYDCYGLMFQHVLDRQLANDVLSDGYFVNPVGPDKAYSARCTTRGGRGYDGTAMCNSNFRSGVNWSEGYENNAFRLMCLCPGAGR